MAAAVHAMYSVLRGRFMFCVGYPLLVAGSVATIFMPELFQPAQCSEQSGPLELISEAGALHLPMLVVVEGLWWLLLGLLSAIGFGAGMPTGLTVLWPWVLRCVADAEACEPMLHLGFFLRILRVVLPFFAAEHLFQILPPKLCSDFAFPL